MKKIFFLFLILFLFQAGFVYALEISYPPVPGAAPPTDLPTYAKYVIYLCMWVAGIIALLGLASGAILYILSTGKPERLINAKEQIVSAFLGLLILLSTSIILNIINPDFTNLDIKPLNVEQLPYKGELELLPVKQLETAIDPEVSPGRIIEKIFEVYISEYPEPVEEDKWTPRVIRLKNRALAAKEIVGKVFDINSDLVDAANDCQCENTQIEAGKFCSSGLSPTQCIPRNLFEGWIFEAECTCDPCANSRSAIIQKEEENHNIVYIGDGITITNQMNRKWEIETIDNSSLIDEILRQEEELRSLKQEFDRLERARKYIEDCPLQSLYSYVQVLDNKKVLESEGGTVRITDFWNDVNIIYNRPKQIKPRYNPIPYEEDQIEYIYDFATFYCDISGTIEQGLSPGIGSTPEALTGEEDVDESEQILSETIACSKEAPFGDYLDRVERTTRLLINNFEEIISLEKELIDTIDKFQEAISQCSSRRCTHNCYYIPLLNICVDWGCNGSPCPDDVNKLFGRIKEIKERIDELVNGEQEEGHWYRHHRHSTPRWIVDKEVDYTDPEQIGIVQILDERIPNLLQELEDIIRYPMKECYFENLEKKGTALFNCSQSQGASNPNGEAIYYCCQTEDESGKLSSAGECYEECYLKENWKKHRDCVYKCLEGKGGNELPYCMHELNFYCCNAGED